MFLSRKCFISFPKKVRLKKHINPTFYFMSRSIESQTFFGTHLGHENQENFQTSFQKDYFAATQKVGLVSQGLKLLDEGCPCPSPCQKESGFQPLNRSEKC